MTHLIVKNSYRIAYYISGHGFGHSTRACAVIKQLLLLGNTVAIITCAPKFIFQELLNGFTESCQYRSISFESGVSQLDAVTVDSQTTMNNLIHFTENLLLDVMDTEKVWLSSWSPSIVCSDAAYVPLAIAKKLSIPSVIISNFTFDAIYEALISNEKEVEPVERCKQIYMNADYLIRLPGYINIPSFTSRLSQIIDVPLVVRKSRAERKAVRQVLNMSMDDPVVLITFGGHELSQLGKAWKGHQILPQGWTGIIIAPGKELDISSLGLPSSRLISVKSEDWYMPDLIHASDVVLSKCGYGMCSEVVAHKKPLIYVPRTKFVEEHGLLENLMKPFGHAIEMSKEQFYRGEWSKHIELAYQLIRTPAQGVLGSDGDVVASQEVMNIIQLSL